MHFILIILTFLKWRTYHYLFMSWVAHLHEEGMVVGWHLGEMALSQCLRPTDDWIFFNNTSGLFQTCLWQQKRIFFNNSSRQKQIFLNKIWGVLWPWKWKQNADVVVFSSHFFCDKARYFKPEYYLFLTFPNLTKCCCVCFFCLNVIRP